MSLYKFDKAKETSSASSSSSAGGGGSVGGNYLPASRTEDGYQVNDETQFVKQLSLVTEDGTKVATMSIDENGRFYFDKGIISAEDVVSYGVEDDDIATVEELIEDRIEANPTETATAALTKLKIGSVVYLVEGGGGGGGSFVWGGVTGSGNAITAINYDSQTGTLSAVKGKTFAELGGALSWTNATNLPEFSGQPPYLLGIEAFADGGRMKWKKAESINVGIFNNNVGYLTSHQSLNVTKTVNNGSSESTSSVSIKQPIFSMSGVGSVNWASGASNNEALVTRNVLAYWNGRYNATASNLKYCEKGEIAGLNSNVASATKLNNARTLWGQSFDGTGNVNGDIELETTDGIALSLLRKMLNSGIYIDLWNNNQKNVGWRFGMTSDNAFGFYYTTNAHSSNSCKLNIDASGNVVAAGDVAAYSDARLKSDIQDLKYRGELNPKTYIKDGKRCVGFIAQEVREIYPELVLGEESEDSYLSLNYGAITAVLAAENKMLKGKVHELEERLTRIEEMLMKGGER